MAFDTTKLKATLGRLPKQFAGHEMKVGWPKGRAYEDGTPVAYIAAIQNFGCPEKSIPPRPFLAPTIKENSARWGKVGAQMVKKVATGDIDAIDALDAVGRVAAMDLQAFIGQLDEPELSAVTVLLRKWRKAGRVITGATVGEAAAAIAAGVNPGTDNKPLNDTGYLIASIAHGTGGKGDTFEAAK